MPISGPLPPRAAWALPLLVLSCLAGALPAQPPGEATLARIRREGVLRWGADPSGGAPFAYKDPNDPDTVIGFEVDIMKRLAGRMGVRLELVRGDWGALIDNLKAGRLDIVMNGLEVNEERARVIAFTSPYYLYKQQLTVRAADRDRYRSLKDLQGKRVAVLNGSASVEVLRQAGWGDDLILEYDDSQKPCTEVELGRAEAALAESIIAAYYAGRDPDLFNVPETFNPGRYAAAVRPGDRDLLDEVNRHLDAMKRSGELGEIYQKWNIWTPEQETLGISKGRAVAVSPEAEGASAGSWGRTLLVLLRGTGVTVLLTLISMPLALLLGLFLALMSLSRSALVSWPAKAYIQVMRGTPLLVQIYLIYFTLPEVGRALGLGDLLVFNNFVVGVICLAANYAAYEAEIHRAGIEAVPRGQTEAALSLGMSESKTLYFVVLPQSFRIILPPVLNDLIAMLKDSSLIYVIGVQELLAEAYGIGKARFQVPLFLALAAAVYLVLSWVADWLGRRVEARLKRSGVTQVPHTAGY